MLNRLLPFLRLAPGEGRPVLRAMAYGFLVLAGYAALKPVRDEIGSEHRELLPTLWTWTFFSVCLVAPLYGWVAARLSRRRLVPAVLGFCIACLLIFFGLLQSLPAGALRSRVEVVFYVWASVFNVYSLSLYWAQMSTQFRSTQSRRLFGLVMLGSTSGAVVGPLLVTVLAPILGVAAMLILAATLIAGATALSLRIEAEGSTAQGFVPGDLRGIGAGLRTVLRSPYLLGVAAYLLLSLIGPGFLYFLKADLAREVFADRGARVQFFSVVEAAGNALTVLLQLTVTGRLMGRFGALPALLILPIGTAVAFAALGTWYALAALVACDLLRRAGNYAFAKPAREVLYTVVGDQERFRAKPLIDTVVYRGGDVGVAWGYEAIAGLGAGAGALAWVVVPCAVVWAAAAVPLGRAHRLREAQTEPTD